MRVWRVTAFGLAAVCPDGLLLFGSTTEQGLRLGRMTFFWIGVALALATAWGRGT
jgi:hypothetical protein